MNCGGHVDWTAIWTFAIAVVTLGAVGVAWRQLAGIRATSRADFTFRFIESFFTPETRTLFLLLMNSALTFEVLEITRGDREPERLPYLKIDQDIVRQISGIASVPSGKTGYSGFELDDLLLGHFESLGWYVKKKLIDYDAAYSTFSDYLMETYEHPEIKKYIGDSDNNDTYEDFLALYKRFKAEQ
jgi:hypothetical protein